MDFLVNSLKSAVSLILSGNTIVYNAAANSLLFSTFAVFIALIPAIISAALLPRHRRTFGSRFVVGVFHSFMAFPTVVIGLLTFALLSRQGPIGHAGLLFSGYAVVLGESLLAYPILTVLFHSSLSAVDPAARETAISLGASQTQALWLECMECRRGFSVAIVTAFGRCLTELGIATMVGGNIEGQTQTLATAISERTSQGLFEQSMAMGIILLSLALALSLTSTFLQERNHAPENS